MISGTSVVQFMRPWQKNGVDKHGRNDDGLKSRGTTGTASCKLLVSLPPLETFTDIAVNTGLGTKLDGMRYFMHNVMNIGQILQTCQGRVSKKCEKV